MEKNYFIQLTLLLYQTTENFSQEELLKLKIRNLADDVLSDLILINSGEDHRITLPERESVFSQAFIDIDDLGEYLTLARSKNLLERDNFLFIRQEYNKIKKEIEGFSKRGAVKEGKKESLSPVQKTPAVLSKPKTEKKEGVLKERQKKIVKILEKEGSAQVNDFQKFLPEVTKRTLRRDLDGLLKQGLVIRIGQWNEVFYKLSN